MKECADSALSLAQSWADMLRKMHSYAEAIVNRVDPEGSTFSFTFQSPIIVFSVAPPNSSGFVLITNQTVNITMRCGTYFFIVQNREWFTNFTYSVYVDDPYGRIYLIIFNPPEQHYEVKTQNETQIYIKNFKPENETVVIVEVGNVTGTEVYFDVVNSSVNPETIIPEFSSLILQIFTLLVASMLIFFIKAKNYTQKCH